MIDKIESCFKRTNKYLINKQEKKGSWLSKPLKHGEPSYYNKEIIVTSEAVKSLIIVGKKNSVDSIKKGIKFCLDYKTEEHDNLEILTYKLDAIKYSNLDKSEKNINEILKILINRKKESVWNSFSSIINLTNFLIISRIPKFDKIKESNKIIKYFKTNKAKDGIGWGKDNLADKSEVTFTSNVFLSLIYSGEDPTKEYLQNFRKFIENKQLKDGSWKQTKITLIKPTNYATALATLSLIILSDNPFNKKVKKGINYLIKNCKKSGGWSLYKDQNREIYVTYFVVYTLGFYRYLKKMWNKKDIIFLRNILENQKVVAYLFLKFEDYLKMKLERKCVENVLDSKILGTTINAVDRRKEILKILSDGKTRDVAAVLDSLKELPTYSNLNKKHHMTQIKGDLEHLRKINLVNKIRNEYFVVLDLINF